MSPLLQAGFETADEIKALQVRDVERITEALDIPNFAKRIKFRNKLEDLLFRNETDNKFKEEENEEEVFYECIQTHIDEEGVICSKNTILTTNKHQSIVEEGVTCLKDLTTDLTTSKTENNKKVFISVH